MNITVTRVGPTPQQFEQNVRFQFITLKQGLVKLGEQARDKMRSVIESDNVRRINKGNLERAIEVHVDKDTADGVVVGVGKIADLNQKAAYWYIVNNGGTAATAKYSKASTPRHFVPGYFEGSQFVYEPTAADGRMMPDGLSTDTVVTQMNFVEKTVAWLKTVVRVHLSGLSGKKQIF